MEKQFKNVSKNENLISSQEDLNILEQCSHIAQNQYGKQQVKIQNEDQNELNLQNASIKNGNQKTYVQEFKKIKNQQREKSIHSEEDIHDQQDQESKEKNKTEQFLFHTVNQQKTLKKMQTGSN